MSTENCPECGGPTYERGMTFGSRDDVLWDSCANCDWDSKKE